MNLNRQGLGVVLLFAGIVLYGMIHIGTIMHLPDVTSWSTQWGRYLQAAFETGGIIGLVLAILLFIIGVTFLLPRPLADLSKGRVMDEIRKRNHEFDEKYGNQNK
ncbi:hypothetical protein [Paenibacillus xylanivorans]|uniref:Uncharacterized protein n=1 Tax=Paenibacillus xylanivorans TaxID=1705561 RepID=A0A0N0C4A8_9BACL|nr:hypothetical protein [Paenibacillus xylanivorans]KOY15525.1 hypothetical protein AMS66_15905 [Paenibacillus xylanivorans]